MSIELLTQPVKFYNKDLELLLTQQKYPFGPILIEAIEELVEAWLTKVQLKLKLASNSIKQEDLDWMREKTNAIKESLKRSKKLCSPSENSEIISSLENKENRIEEVSNSLADIKISEPDEASGLNDFEGG